MAKKARSLPKIPGVSGGRGTLHNSATIAVYSVKGGVGKTTLSANLAFCSAKAGHSTLLWDLDAAGGAGYLYGIDAREAKPAESLFSRDRAAEKLIKSTGYENLDLLPADESIRSLDETLVALGKRRRVAKLTQSLGKRYERIILDCPPVLNELSAQVMRAADLVIVPLPPSPLSRRAFDLVIREVAANRKGHQPILPVLSMLDARRTLHREAKEANPGWPVIPYASIVEQGAVRQMPVGAFAPSSSSAHCFASLWQAIDQKLATMPAS